MMGAAMFSPYLSNKFLYLETVIIQEWLTITDRLIWGLLLVCGHLVNTCFRACTAKHVAMSLIFHGLCIENVTMVQSETQISRSPFLYYDFV